VLRLIFAVLLIALSYPLMEKAVSLKPKSVERGEVPVLSYKKLLLSFPTFNQAVADLIYVYNAYLVGGSVSGKRSLNCKEWERLVKNEEVAVKLDPYNFDLYYFLGAYLPWQVRRCEGLVEKVNAVLKEGLGKVVDWRIPFFIGFNYFYFLGSKVEGAEYLKRASSMKGSPKYLKLLIPRLYAQSGRLDFAVAVTAEELKRAKDEKLKEELQKRLEALLEIKRLQELVNLYRRRFGVCPPSLRALIEVGLIRRLPKDPYGGKFVLKEGCKVWTTSDLRPVKGSSDR
jgi:tetratricopeptide (TPR) repeat protein